MESILSPHYTGPPFELFGASHVGTILAMALVGLLIVRTGMRGRDAVQRRLRRLMVAVLLFWEVEWQLWFIVTGQWSLKQQLPLHVCSIMIWVGIYALITRDERVYPFVYFFGIGASLQAVITPDAVFDFPHVRFLNTMISHCLLVIVGFWIVLVERYRPNWRDVVTALVVINLYAVAVYPIDLLIDANYAYVVDKPATPSLLDYFPDWPWYLLPIEGIAAALFALMYWPFRRVKPQIANSKYQIPNA